MEDAGEALLADPRFAEEQHRQVAREERVHLGEEGAHGRGVARHVPFGNARAACGVGGPGRGGGRGRGRTVAAGQLQDEEGDPQHPIGLRLGPHVPGQAQAERAVAGARERTAQGGIAPAGHDPRHLRALFERRLFPKQRQAREVGDDPARGQRDDLSALPREQAAPLGAGLAEEEVERAQKVASGRVSR